jgi:hypothetical protein
MICTQSLYSRSRSLLFKPHVMSAMKSIGAKLLVARMWMPSTNMRQKTALRLTPFIIDGNGRESVHIIGALWQVSSDVRIARKAMTSK